MKALDPDKDDDSQRGSAILMAMLIMALVTTMVATINWQQWQSIEVEVQDRKRTQSEWVIFGAIDWARLILREDGKSGIIDHLNEPWSIPLERARLSSFLAFDNQDSLEAQASQKSFLSGQIIDMQSKLNINNLIRNGEINIQARSAFLKLFKLLDIREVELDQFCQTFLKAQKSLSINSENIQNNLIPSRVSELGWLGMSSKTIKKIDPFVTVLPETTLVNLNTAPAEVIYALVPGLELIDAKFLISEREKTPFSNWAEIQSIKNKKSALVSESLFSLNTNYFAILGIIDLDSSKVHIRSLVNRSGLNVNIISSERGVDSLTKIY